MSGLEEVVSSGIESSSLTEQANSLDSLSEEELNSPIEGGNIEPKDIASNIGDSEVLPNEELNTPIEGDNIEPEDIASNIGDSEVLPKNDLNCSIEGENAESKDIVPSIQDSELSSQEELNSPIEQSKSVERPELSLEEKTLLKSETNWSDRTIDAIRTPEEANVYKEAGLKEVNGNLERPDIDWNAKIPQNKIDRMRSLYGDDVADRWSDKTNMDLIKEGRAPYGPDGEVVNLHHIGQKTDSPLAELTYTEHKSNDGILHDKTKESEIERPVFRKEREAYWRQRGEELNK
jgi:hypothetical protein